MKEAISELRLRIAEIDRKYAIRPVATEQPSTAPPVGRAGPVPALRYIQDWLGGEVAETRFGRHFETEKLYESHRHHGSADIGALADLPHDLLQTISGGEIDSVPPQHWAFLDTETSGAAGAGACAFLVGVGRITREGFRVRQFFMRDYSEEASLLDALSRHLGSFRVMITYNGRAFDQPLLETRYRLARVRHPFAGFGHLDLLHGARRLWKLRFESRRLVDLENRVLGVERQGDVPGALIPYIYFDYLRTRQAARLLPVFHHNAIDILSLACLTGIVPYAFQDPAGARFTHGAEMAGIARWLKEAGQTDQARTLFRRAIDAGLPDSVLFPTLWDLAALERKFGAEAEALAIWKDLSSARNPLQTRALEALAKHHEHRTKDREQALEFTRAARELEDSPGLQRREARLLERLVARDKMKPHGKTRRSQAPRSVRGRIVEA
ncbi:MAG: ribonuclease H-like domain-containing protein [Bryobacterales bacterium]|nr:ribonuclease H-like domain-containing protein [Bryobacterales bacterium]MBV9396331.1 ribonuclease H-like domain-containing protein [Bryobacterales bacterium]